MDSIKINLATFEYQNKRIAYPMLIGAAIILLLVSWYTVQTSHQYQNEIFEYEKRIDDLEQKGVTRQKISEDKKTKLSEEEIKSIQNDIHFVNQRIVDDVFPWNHLLDSLEVDMPNGVILSNFSISKNPTKAELRGEAKSMKEIGMFLANLDKSKAFQNSHLINLSINADSHDQNDVGSENQSINYEIESYFNIDQIIERKSTGGG